MHMRLDDPEDLRKLFCNNIVHASVISDRADHLAEKQDPDSPEVIHDQKSIELSGRTPTKYSWKNDLITRMMEDTHKALSLSESRSSSSSSSKDGFYIESNSMKRPLSLPTKIDSDSNSPCNGERTSSASKNNHEKLRRVQSHSPPRSLNPHGNYLDTSRIGNIPIYVPTAGYAPSHHTPHGYNVSHMQQCQLIPTPTINLMSNPYFMQNHPFVQPYSFSSAALVPNTLQSMVSNDHSQVNEPKETLRPHTT